VQSPGVKVLLDNAAFARLEPYVAGVVGHLRDDPRVEGWDVWNEPENWNPSAYGPLDMKQGKAEIVLPLLEQAFGWVRAARPSQPVTSGVWLWNPDFSEKLSPVQQFQLEAADIVSFHAYMPLPGTKAAIESLKRHGRPLMCTEYMARPTGSTFEAILPLLKDEGIAAYNWGAVSGRSQTIYPWDSWQSPYPEEPALWFHDILRPDGAPFRREEADLIRRLAAPSGNAR
jgi:hypothetical protein